MGGEKTEKVSGERSNQDGSGGSFRAVPFSKVCRRCYPLAAKGPTSRNTPAHETQTRPSSTSKMPPATTPT